MSSSEPDKNNNNSTKSTIISLPEANNSTQIATDTPSIPYDKSKIDFTEGSNSPQDFKYYPDTPNSVVNKLQFESKQPSKFYDPCIESSRMSIRCLEINGRENKAICNEYFQAYRDCKKAWVCSLYFTFYFSLSSSLMLLSIVCRHWY